MHAQVHVGYTVNLPSTFMLEQQVGRDLQKSKRQPKHHCTKVQQCWMYSFCIEVYPDAIWVSKRESPQHTSPIQPVTIQRPLLITRDIEQYISGLVCQCCHRGFIRIVQIAVGEGVKFEVY